MRFARSLEVRSCHEAPGAISARRVLLALACAASAASAHAYIDPGSGYLLFQAIAAVIAAIGATIGLYWRKFKGLLRRMTGRPEEETGSTPAEAPPPVGENGGDKRIGR